VKARASVIAGIVAATALLAGYLATWAPVSDFRQTGSDFSASYTAALLIREGHGAALYDQAAEQSRHLALLPPGTRLTLPFVTPPTTALIALPFTALDPATASRLFALLEVAVLGAAVLIVVRAAPWPPGIPRGARLATGAIALAGVPTLALLLLAQFDALCALGLAAGYAMWRRARPLPAGFCLALGFAVAKPHLAAGLLVFLLARRDWRALLGAAGAAALAVAVSAALAGPGAVLSFFGDLGYSLRVTPGPSTVGLPGLAASWLGGGPAAALAAVAGAVAALAGCAVLGHRSRRTPDLLELTLAGAVALSLAASPHLLTYDLVALAPAFVWCMGRMATIDGSVAWPGRFSLAAATGWAIANVVIDLDLGNGAPAPPGRLVPWVLVLAGLGAVGAARRPHVPRGFIPVLLQSGRGRAAGGSSA